MIKKKKNKLIHALKEFLYKHESHVLTILE